MIPVGPARPLPVWRNFMGNSNLYCKRRNLARESNSIIGDYRKRWSQEGKETAALGPQDPPSSECALFRMRSSERASDSIWMLLSYWH